MIRAGAALAWRALPWITLPWIALPLAQVRHEMGENLVKFFGISLGSRQVYTTFVVVFEAIR